MENNEKKIFKKVIKHLRSIYKKEVRFSIAFNQPGRSYQVYDTSNMKTIEVPFVITKNSKKVLHDASSLMCYFIDELSNKKADFDIKVTLHKHGFNLITTLNNKLLCFSFIIFKYFEQTESVMQCYSDRSNDKFYFWKEFTEHNLNDFDDLSVVNMFYSGAFSMKKIRK